MPQVLVLMTGEWSDALDPAAGVLGPRALGFFIQVAMLGQYLVINLFIGVLHETYMRLGAVDPNVLGALQSREDRRWAEFEHKIRQERPITARPEPSARARHACFKVAQSLAFDRAVTATLLLNAVMLCTMHDDEPIALEGVACVEVTTRFAQGWQLHDFPLYLALDAWYGMSVRIPAVSGGRL